MRARTATTAKEKRAPRPCTTTLTASVRLQGITTWPRRSSHLAREASRPTNAPPLLGTRRRYQRTCEARGPGSSGAVRVCGEDHVEVLLGQPSIAAVLQQPLPPSAAHSVALLGRHGGVPPDLAATARRVAGRHEGPAPRLVDHRRVPLIRGQDRPTGDHVVDELVQRLSELPDPRGVGREVEQVALLELRLRPRPWAPWARTSTLRRGRRTAP